MPDIITELSDRWRGAEHLDQAGKLSAIITKLVELRDEIESVSDGAANHQIALGAMRTGIDQALTWAFSIAESEPIHKPKTRLVKNQDGEFEWQ